jgi:hypothetical protein
VGSHDLEILACNARYPGSVHDSFIWKYSRMREIMKAHWENGNKNHWLLGMYLFPDFLFICLYSFLLLFKILIGIIAGDSGYPLEPWLMTPIHHAVEGTPEYAYTRAHCQTRNCVERLFGTWKNTFRCLMEDRVLHYEPVVAAKIVLALAVLHNMRRHYNTMNEDSSSDSDDSDSEDERERQQLNGGRRQQQRQDVERDENEGRVGGELLQEATRVRNRIIRDNYTDVEE